MPRPALLVLEDGVSFAGEALTGSGTVGGELVFTTGMAGYQEVASDPSYHGQIIVYTFPMVGNYGAAPGLDESPGAAPPAIVAREITNYAFNRVAESGWLSWLAGRGIIAVTGVDTRAVTRHIRQLGALRAVVSTETHDVEALRAAARRVPPMGGRDLAAEVTCGEVREVAPADSSVARLHVVVVDLGVKRSILDLLLAEGCRLTVVPASTSAKAILKLAPDGVLLSNGPGDPAAVTYGVKTTRRLLGSVPVFGICLGHQLLALALGLDTFKLPFGHRGINHPVKDLRSGRVEITTQNHGFAVRQPDRLPPGVELTHVNLNDGTVEGLADMPRYAFSVQYHPEASPGPYDARYLFARFAAVMEEFRASGAGRDADDAGTAEEEKGAEAAAKKRASASARFAGGQASAGGQAPAGAPSPATTPGSAGAGGREASRGEGAANPESSTAEPRKADRRGHTREGRGQLSVEAGETREATDTVDPDDRSETTPRQRRPSLRDALRGHLGSLGDLGRRER